jgi:tetratricopeptide (TPR) repeat protein
MSRPEIPLYAKIALQSAANVFALRAARQQRALQLLSRLSGAAGHDDSIPDDAFDPGAFFGATPNAPPDQEPQGSRFEDGPKTSSDPNVEADLRARVEDLERELKLKEEQRRAEAEAARAREALLLAMEAELAASEAASHALGAKLAAAQEMALRALEKQRATALELEKRLAAEAQQAARDLEEQAAAEAEQAARALEEQAAAEAEQAAARALDEKAAAEAEQAARALEEKLAAEAEQAARALDEKAAAEAEQPAYAPEEEKKTAPRTFEDQRADAMRVLQYAREAGAARDRGAHDQAIAAYGRLEAMCRDLWDGTRATYRIGEVLADCLCCQAELAPHGDPLAKLEEANRIVHQIANGGGGPTASDHVIHVSSALAHALFSRGRPERSLQVAQGALRLLKQRPPKNNLGAYGHALRALVRRIEAAKTSYAQIPGGAAHGLR